MNDSYMCLLFKWSANKTQIITTTIWKYVMLTLTLTLTAGHNMPCNCTCRITRCTRVSIAYSYFIHSFFDYLKTHLPTICILLLSLLFLSFYYYCYISSHLVDSALIYSYHHRNTTSSYRWLYTPTHAFLSTQSIMTNIYMLFRVQLHAKYTE